MGRAVKLSPNISTLEYVIGFLGDGTARDVLIFPGKRPVYFLKKLLALRKRSAFFPPTTFSVDGFIREIHRNFFGSFKEPTILEAAWLSYETGREMGLPLFTSFSSSFFWAMKFYEAVEELEKGLVDQRKIRQITLQPHYELRPVEEMMGRLAEFRERFLERLRREGMRSSGMIYREVAEGIETRSLPWRGRVILVGLSALTNSERKIFSTIMKEKNSLFIYQEVEGSEDIYPYLKDWELEVEEIKESGFSPSITLHPASGIHGQGLVLQNLLGELPSEETVVVIPDPSLLLPVLSQGLCGHKGEYNVSVGYPIARTPVYALLLRVMELQQTRRDGLYHTGKYMEFLLHPYIKNLYFKGQRGETETSRKILHHLEEKLIDIGKPFISLSDVEKMDLSIRDIAEEDIKGHIRMIHDKFIRPLEKARNFPQVIDAILLALKEIWEKSPARFYPLARPFFKRFFTLLEEVGRVKFLEEVSLQDSFNIIRNSLIYERVPFEGTPVKGLQVLGQLETRALRFRNVIYMGANENFLPATEPVDPLLPTPLRKELGIPTFRERERIIRFYFMRLIRGAERVHIIYDSSEVSARSRFVEELVWEAQKKGSELPERVYLPDFLIGKEGLKVEKNERIMEKLREFKFSPSSLDVYMTCPLKFYLRFMLRVEEKREIEEEPENRRIGEFLHRILEEFYRSTLGREANLGDLSYERLKKIVEKKFREYFPWEGGEFALIKTIMLERLKKFLEWEREALPFEILYLEAEFDGKIDLDGRKISLKGKLDRVQRRNSKIEVIDYKLSSGKAPKKNMEGAMEERKEMAKNIKSFQLPIYLYLLKQKGLIEDYSQSQAYFYPMGFKINKKRFEPSSLWPSKKKELDPAYLMREVYMPSLKNLISEILNPDLPFTASPSNPDVCDYCPFRSLCGK